jgi:hypothetical protein
MLASYGTDDTLVLSHTRLARNTPECELASSVGFRAARAADRLCVPALAKRPSWQGILKLHKALPDSRPRNQSSGGRAPPGFGTPRSPTKYENADLPECWVNVIGPTHKSQPGTANVGCWLLAGVLVRVSWEAREAANQASQLAINP